MICRSLIFAAPEEVFVQEENLPSPGNGQVLVHALKSAISPGTEMLAYTGRIPQELPRDETIASLSSGSFHFPFKYGYSSVGEVVDLGEGSDPEWLGKKVFSFHPHESAFVADTSELMEIPADISLEDALFLPNMETAVNFVMDGRPMIGESVAVFGLGIVGLLTTSLLTRFPLTTLLAFDPVEMRRKEAQRLGNVTALDPNEPGVLKQAMSLLGSKDPSDGADLVFEISGSPAALNQAISITRFDGRIVVGSWYGRKMVQLDLGGRFHRGRIRLVSSQVSTVAPDLTGRWSKSRRMDVAWDCLRQIRPAHWITHRFPLDSAADAYQLLAEKPQEAVQVVLEYGKGN